MFLKHSLFKRLLKKDTEKGGILMAHDGEGYYLEGSWWRAYIDKNTMDKETKSILIGISGAFPNEQAFRAYKEISQYEFKDPGEIQVYKETPEDCLELKDTRIEIVTQYNDLHLYAVKGKRAIIAIDRQITEMLNRKTAKDTEDDYPEKPVIFPDRNEICWCSDKMIFSCMRVEIGAEEQIKLIEHLENFDF